MSYYLEETSLFKKKKLSFQFLTSKTKESLQEPIRFWFQINTKRWRKREYRYWQIHRDVIVYIFAH